LVCDRQVRQSAGIDAGAASPADKRLRQPAMKPYCSSAL
jgi:hypothetical protein